jgi:ribosomal protein S20
MGTSAENVLRNIQQFSAMKQFINFLDTKFTSPDKEKMKELFKAYFQYEE